MSHSTVAVTDVGHTYSSSTVLTGVSFTLTQGQLVALTGPSGSGKSTVSQLVAGIEPPTTGQIHVLGRPATRIADWATLSFVPQRLGLVPGLTVAHNMTLVLPPGREAVNLEALLSRMNLATLSGRLVEEISLGEQQRVAVGRALIAQPRVVVLDEPTGHQDEANVGVVVDALREVTASGTTALIATHDEMLTACADRVLVMHAGRMVEQV